MTAAVAPRLVLAWGNSSRGDDALGPLLAERLAGGGIGSHALAPEAVLQVYQDLHGQPPPASTLLAIRASAFELGTAPSAEALADLDLAIAWACRWLSGEHIAEEVSA